jgi:hypothetical protein
MAQSSNKKKSGPERNLQRKGPHGSGTKQLSVAKGGVYDVQPEGAWRNAATQ